MPSLFSPHSSPHTTRPSRSFGNRLLPPVFVPGGSPEHLLGTDGNGRDLLSRIIVGSRLSLVIGGATVLIGGTIGVSAGIVAGLRGGWFDVVAGRLADVQQAIPFIILALAVVGVLGSSVVDLIIVLGVGSWFYWYRVVRGEVLALREQPFIEAARAVGVGDWQLIRRHLWRNLTPSIIVLATLWLPQAIAYTAGLSFLGLGVPPPTPEWGRLHRRRHRADRRRVVAGGAPLGGARRHGSRADAHWGLAAGRGRPGPATGEAGLRRG